MGEELGVVQERAAASQGKHWSPQDATYYGLLELSSAASVEAIRRAYREKSKLFHPDTTDLPPAIATEKFQQLNEAYATLSSPERRLIYDRQLSGSPSLVNQTTANSAGARNAKVKTPSAYLDPRDRPLSAGELFALFILGLTFLGCLVLAIVLGCTRGEVALKTAGFQPLIDPQVTVTQPPPAPSVSATSLEQPPAPPESEPALPAPLSPSPALETADLPNS